MLAARGLTKEFNRRRRLGGPSVKTRAVIDFSFELGRRQTLGIAGESGSGKTTVARLLLLLERPNAGQILFRGRPIDADARGAGLTAYRRAVQAVFQDVGGSLDPRMPVAELVVEPLRFLAREQYRGKADRLARAREVLDMVGLDARTLEKYPHHLSGGQRQRVAIARALSTHPEVIIMDEPISALDTSIRNQILNLLDELQRSTGLAYVIIAHDLAMLARATDFVIVMYLGQTFETGPTRTVLEHPVHPYTIDLLKATPTISSRRTVKAAMRGETSGEPLTGCHFHPRCAFARPECKVAAPPARAAGDHMAACHLFAPTIEPDGPPAHELALEDTQNGN